MNDTKGITARVIERNGGAVRWQEPDSTTEGFCLVADTGYVEWLDDEVWFHADGSLLGRAVNALLETHASQLAEDQRERLKLVREALERICKSPSSPNTVYEQAQLALSSLDEEGLKV